ncbi:hypothetical protein SA2016_1011 [Sinomonas atrocyanea]|uniref:Uncharacterized protein n=1 Tax=Sinomonas atrocyanea TaxID=37927 RepID=A0A126ZXT7_9MICC|nr:hypothetical protein [Sinomonas atrocyanea]AMM31696.1 hypothetical protein SA2016_1011 [Sinomonas atrocyanea]GEB65314.1 hypothetical protein SAT01_27620 [Sinomonas atrocyanea]GGG59320.1 hypothetical protein GCM10007172_07730 [Sinomonas atrocyanea]
MDYTPSDRVYLEDDLGLDTAWLAARIVEDPALLALGETELAVEHIAPSDRPGSLTVHLADPTAGIWHVAEVKLSDADTDQVLHVLTLWLGSHTDPTGAERQPSVVAEHIPPAVARAVLMAQEVAPLGAYELHALQVGDQVVLHTEPVHPPEVTDAAADHELATRLAEAVARLQGHSPEQAADLRLRMIGRLYRHDDRGPADPPAPA